MLMKRINVTLYDEVLEELENRTKEKKSRSIAQSIRELMDLGMRIEKAAAQDYSLKNETTDTDLILDSLKNMMRWVLESLLISRQVLIISQPENRDESEALLKKCKEQAINHVNKMFPVTGEMNN